MKKIKKSSGLGFTTVELVLVFVIIAIITGIVAGNLLTFRHRVSTETATSSIINDIKEQQNRAMLGESEQTISFNSTSYQMNDFNVDLDPSLQITNITFPEEKIVFASISGEIVGFTPGQNTLIIQNSFNNQAKIININRFGVITSVL